MTKKPIKHKVVDGKIDVFGHKYQHISWDINLFWFMYA